MRYGNHWMTYYLISERHLNNHDHQQLFIYVEHKLQEKTKGQFRTYLEAVLDNRIRSSVRYGLFSRSVATE
jgi:hypothetical protein